MTPQEIMNLFFYRKSPYAIKISAGHYIPVRRVDHDVEITTQIIEKHLRGEHTIGCYQSRSDETCMWACIDFDQVSYRDVARRIANDCSEVMRSNPESSISKILFEPSESRGYHVWFFFKSPQSTSDAYIFVNHILEREELYPSRESHIDIFPRSPHLTGKRLGWLVRLPRGI